MLKGFQKARRQPKVSTEMKCTNEMMIWNTQDTNLSSYVPKANVDHTISWQGICINTLDHSATTSHNFKKSLKSYMFTQEYGVQISS